MVTILVAAEGGVKLPKVTSLEELRSALNTLGGISESQVYFHNSTHLMVVLLSQSSLLAKHRASSLAMKQACIILKRVAFFFLTWSFECRLWQWRSLGHLRIPATITRGMT